MRYHSLGAAHLTACLALARSLEHGTSGGTPGQHSSSGRSDDNSSSHEDHIMAYHLYSLVDVKAFCSAENKSAGNAFFDLN